VARAYESYYKAFKKTCHVQLRLEFVALKRQSVPRVDSLVEAMFVAELKHRLLTAGHDLAAIRGSVRVGVAAGDMMMADEEGVICSVLYGPDRRTRITPSTRDVFFAVYAPAGIGRGAVRDHPQDLQANVQLIAPAAQMETLEVHGGE